MNIKKNSKMLSSLAMVCALYTYPNEAQAGIVKIINNASSSIRTSIIREPASQCLPYCEKCLDGKSKTNGKQSAEIVVPLSAFNGYEYFAVNGTEGGIFGNGTCRNLNIFKNYEVSFYNTFMGVGCKSREI
jgi:hypothetical protein